MLLGQIQAEIEGPQTNPGANVRPTDAGASAGLRSGPEQELISNAREMVEALTVQIQSSATAADESRLERLLGLCDRLNGGIDTLISRVSRRSLLHGLGLKIDSLNSSSTGVGANGETTVHEDEENIPLTPRVDKGKGRAEPEPEEPEKVLSPTFMIAESEDEDEDDHRYLDVEEGEEVGVQATSPTDRYVRFRHGGVHLGLVGVDAGADVCV